MTQSGRVRSDFIRMVIDLFIKSKGAMFLSDKNVVGGMTKDVKLGRRVGVQLKFYSEALNIKKAELIGKLIMGAFDEVPLSTWLEVLKKCQDIKIILNKLRKDL